jgi:hypothetical protein
MTITWEREHILSEIRRTAAANGGVPLDVDRFFAETGVKESDWRGIFWARWADALQDAGVQPYQPPAPTAYYYPFGAFVGIRWKRW